MKTKVTVLGSNEVEQPENKKIEFWQCLDSECNMRSAAGSENPIEWEGIVLISKSYGSGNMDVMFAYDGDLSNPKNRGLFLGHFNDGIV